VPRRLKVQTRELGFVELYVIYSTAGEWEPEWKALQGTSLAALFTTLSKVNYDHVLKGYSSPFVKALGLPPQGALRKMAPQSHLCANRVGCTLFDKVDCLPTAKRMPHCYQPEGLPSEEARILGYEVVRLWREGVYVAVVEEPAHAR
jgi:hypothetical protein